MNKVHNPLNGPAPELQVDLSLDPSLDQVSIIVVHRNQPDFLNICLQSIAVTSLNNNFELIVIDNQSTQKEAIDFLNDLQTHGSEIKVIRNKENVWWSKAANQGAKAASKTSKYLIFLHADVVILNPAWIDLLISVSEAKQGAGLVGVSMNSYMMDNQKVDFIDEWCMLVSRDCYNDVGGFSEDLPLVGSAFVFTLAAQIAEHNPQVIANNLAHHYATFGIDRSSFEELTEIAMKEIPKQIRDLPTKVKKKKK